MKTLRESVRPTLAAMFRWGSVPGSPSEVRAYVQRRMRIYLGFSSAFWGAAFVLTSILTALTHPEELLTGWHAVRTVAHAVMVFMVTALWWAARRKDRSTSWLTSIDIGTSALQGVLLALLLVGLVPLIRYRPDLIVILAMTYFLVARAAVVPSATSRTILVGLLACVPLCAAVWVTYELAFTRGLAVAQHYPGDHATPLLFFLWSIIYCGLTVVLSTFVSYVIHGLERAVQHARRLGQYTLEAKIGEGGMGVVYRGRHALLRRPTALKLLPPERAGAAAVARFEREVQITSQLTHPNTVAIYDYGRTPQNVFYYAMEYLDGADLEELVRHHGPQPAARVRHLIRQVVGALGEAHGRGIIHRDIKPSNVIVCERGTIPDFVKVLDFGLARDFDKGGSALTQTGQLTGTPLYMSPEQILGDPLDGRSDLYPVGAMAYYLLTGQPVFSGESVVEVCAHHIHSPVVPPSLRSAAPIPASLERVILACLAKSPADRPSDAGALIDLLDACDDVAPWTVHDARRWWVEHGAGLQRPPESDAPKSGAVPLDVALDVSLEQRAR